MKLFQDPDEHFKRFRALKEQKTDNGKKLTPIEAKKIVDSTKDIINPSFEGWYFKKLYEIGIYKYMELADIARKGRNPRGLFAYWLKNS